MTVFTAPGACERCSSTLAAGQRYCLSCGERRGELPALFRPPERERRAVRALSLGALPARRSFGAVGTVVLASGVLIGAAVGPALTPSSFASAAGQVLVVADAPAGAASTTAGLSKPGAAGGELAAPTGNVSVPKRQVAAVADTAPAPPAATPASAPPSSEPSPDTPAPQAPQAPEEKPTVAGTVVHVSHDGKGYAVATREGQLLALHTKKAPELGERLKTTVRALDNGTFKELEPDLRGQADSAKFHGTVTFTDPSAGAYTVSARGVSLLVHLPAPDPAAPPRELPAVGILTTVEVAFRPVTEGEPALQLAETAREDGDPAAGEIDLEAIVREVTPDRSQLTVSADDAGESPGTLVLRVPPDVDVSKLKPDAVIAATVTREADGSLTLVTVSNDS